MSEIIWHRKQSHGELLVSRIDQALKWAELTPQDMDLVAVDIGPGSFTGIRVGINAAKAFSYSMNIPVRAFNSLEATVAGIPSLFAKPILAIINSHDGHFYMSRFSPSKSGWRGTGKVIAVPCEKIETYLAKTPLFVTDDSETVAKFCSPKLSKKITCIGERNTYPTASALVQLAALATTTGKTLDWKTLMPLYIRASGAEEKMKKSFVRGRGVHGGSNGSFRQQS